MTDIRSRLVDALQFHLGEYGLHHSGKGLDTYLADVLLSLPGIAITQLPPPDSKRYEGAEHDHMDRDAWITDGWAASVWEYPEVQLSGRCRDGFWQTFEPISIDEARALAAALLAAADAAEQSGAS